MVIRYHTREGWVRLVGDRVSFAGHPIAQEIRSGRYDREIQEACADVDLPFHVDEPCAFDPSTGDQRMR